MVPVLELELAMGIVWDIEVEVMIIAITEEEEEEEGTNIRGHHRCMKGQGIPTGQGHHT